MWWQEEVGNYYAPLWGDSVAVATELAAPGRLASVAQDIGAHLSVVQGPTPSSGLPPSPIPTWLLDSLTNQFSHFRHMHYLKDGRMREYEANDVRAECGGGRVRLQTFTQHTHIHAHACTCSHMTCSARMLTACTMTCVALPSGRRRRRPPRATHCQC